MKITVLTKIYNEEFLLPFFFDHYSYADEFIINLDVDTNDKSIEIIENNPRAKIHWSRCVGGGNDRIFIEEANEIASQCKSDWLIYVESDEFIFPRGFADVRTTLATANGNVIYASMWQVYKHETDVDLDTTKPALLQRRHGDPNRTEGYNAHYTKPIIINPAVQISWHPGHQTHHPNDKIKVATNVMFDGAHWRLVDIPLAILRRIKGRKEHFSDESKQMGWGGQHFDITEEKIMAEYEEHKNDPLLF
jgi:hypothetical protein